MAFVAGNSTGLFTAGTASSNQPFTLVAVAMQTGGLGANNGIFSSGNTELTFEASASNLAFIYAGGSNVSQTQTANAWHSIAGAANGASSLTYVDGVGGTTANAGSNTISSSQLFLGRSAFAEFMTGDVVEVLAYPVAFTGPNDTTMCHNQYSYWGTSTSC